MFFKNQNIVSNKRGIGLIEVVIASAIMLVAIVIIIKTYGTYISFALGNQNNTKANFLLEEGLETLIFLRDGGWSTNITTLNSGTTYYLHFDGTTWLSTTTPEYIDSNFLRSFVLVNVNRDVNDDISSSGTNDPNTKKVTVTIAYSQGNATTTKTLSTYLTNLYDN